MEGWPRVVVEDVVQQTQQLKNEMLVMGGKIQGKPLLPLPEDGSSTVQDWWVLLALLGASKAWQGPKVASGGDKNWHMGLVPHHPGAPLISKTPLRGSC